MYGESVTCELSLSSPPIVRYTHINQSSTRQIAFKTNPPHWGLDFYRHAGMVEFLDTGEKVTFEPGDIGIIGPSPNIRVFDEEDRDSIYFSFDLVGLQGEKIILPALLRMGNQYDMLQDMALDAVRAWPNQPTQTKALLWAILWELANSHGNFNPNPRIAHHAVRDAVEIIELELSSDLRLPYLADRVGLAASSLSRLFHKHVGITLIAHVRKRRIERASFLLSHTDMPIKEIAYRVGITDLHVFNKTFRRELAVCPSYFRRESQSADK